MKKIEKQQVIKSYLGKEVCRIGKFSFGLDSRGCIYIEVCGVKMNVAQAKEMYNVLESKSNAFSLIIKESEMFIEMYC